MPAATVLTVMAIEAMGGAGAGLWCALRHVRRFNTNNRIGILPMSHPVDDDPVMASAIGRCSNQWTHAESRLAWIFANLTQTDIVVAVTVFSVFKSTRTQAEVLKKLAKIVPFVTKDLRDRLFRLLKAYSALAEERNQLLHNPVGRSVDNEVYIMLRSPNPVLGELPYHTKPIATAEIDELAAKIRNLNIDLTNLQHAISDARFGKQ
jgi:hypothetical protein